MIEVVLAVIVVALLVERAYLVRAHRQDHRRLTNALMAKHASEFLALEHEPRKKKREESVKMKKALALDNPLGL